MLSADYDKIPLATVASLNQYTDHHISPGGFLSSVLANNLVDSFAKADDANRAALWEIAGYCHWELPSQCWGDEAKVKAWLSNNEDTVGHTHTNKLSQ